MRQEYSGQNVGQTHKSIQLIKHIDRVRSSPAVCSFSHLSTSLFSTSASCNQSLPDLHLVTLSDTTYFKRLIFYFILHGIFLHFPLKQS